MPLTPYVLGWTAELDQLVRDESVAVIDVAVPDENREMVSRIVVNWAARDGGNAAFVGVDLSSPAAFARTLREGLLEVVRQVSLSASGTTLLSGEPPAVPEDATDPRCGVKAANAVARWAAHVASPLVLGGRLPRAADTGWIPDAVRESTHRLRWLVVRDERDCCPFTEIAVRRHVTHLLPGSLETARAQLDRFARSDASLVVSYEGPVGRSVEWILGELRQRLPGWEMTTVLEETASGAELAVSALARLDELESTAGDPVRELALAMERRSRERPLIMVLGATVRGPAPDVVRMALALAHELLGQACRVVVVAEHLPGIVPRHGMVSRLPFRVDADRIERGLVDALERADLSVAQRVHMEAALASFAAGHGALDAAIERAERAARVALEARSADLLAGALYALGSVLCRAERYVEGVEALTRCAEISSAFEQPALVGRALSAIGHVFFRFERWDDCARCYTAAISASTAAGDPAGAMHASTWLAEAQRGAGRTAEAAVTLDALANGRAIAVPRQLGELLAPLRGEAHARLAALLASVGLEERRRAAQQAATEAGHHGPLTCCPLP